MRTEEEYKADDTEITLGIGKLLGLFILLVVLCGISLGVGYSLGRNSMKQALAAASNPSAAPVPAPLAASNKPIAATVTPPPEPVAAKPEDTAPTPAPANSADANFPKSLSNTQKEEHPKLATPAASAPAPAAPATHPSLGAGYMVQVAAVRNQDDAKLLSNALKRQRFPVVIVQPGDKLYHVQVGPYPDAKEAEVTRAKLIGAGYNAFLKR
ncbi:MAG: SPOR domain-containing protein [Acidobacteriota bacterium]|nr:SPOR domain-containing protein [Acidobacteriota bacterium]